METRAEARIFSRCVSVLCALSVVSGESLGTHLQLSKCEEGGAHGEELQAYW